MKRIIVAVVLFMMYGIGYGQTVDSRRCIMKAKAFMEGRMSKSVDKRQLKEVSLSIQDAPQLKAFNLEDGGFVLLLDRSGEPVVIGYSDHGSVSTTTMPDPMRQWLENYDASDASVAAKAPLTLSYTPVAPLLNTKWGQREPFNSMCPTYDDKHTVVGCTAVALAQILYHYKSSNTSTVVEEYVNQATSTEISVDYSKGNYDWANMLPSYDGAYTDKQANAVARLMYEAGVACHCKFGISSTSGSQPFVALQQHYNFECNYFYRPYVSTEMWMTTIQQNLLEGKPIVYSGGSHCYIVDGIDADGLCHVNWGWNGLDDGYYDIALSNPTSSSDSYVSQQCMITDIRPRQAGELYEAKVVQAGTMENMACTALTSNSYTSASYDTGCGFINDANPDGDLESVSWNKNPKTLAFPTIKLPGGNGAVVGGGTNTANMPDGIYRQCLVYGEKGDTASWKIAEWPLEYMTTIEVKDGKYVYENHNDTVYLHDLQTVNDACNGSYFYLMLEMELDREYRGSSTPSLPVITFENIETHKKYIQKGATVTGASDMPTYYPNVKAKAVYRVRPTNPDNDFTMPAGTYRFAFNEPDTRWANATNDDFLITIADKPDYPMLDVPTSNIYYYSQSYSDAIKVLQNSEYKDTDIPKFYPYKVYSANNVGGKVVMNIYATREGETEETFVCSIPDFEVNANSENNTKYDLPVRLFPMQGAYKFSYRYLTPDGERTLLNPMVQGQRVYVWNTNNNPYLVAASEIATVDGGIETGNKASLQLQVKNRGNSLFEGKIAATLINKATGDCVKTATDVVSIPSGQEAEVMFTPTLPSEGSYDVYFDGVAEGRSYGIAVLESDLQQRAHQTLNVGTLGIVSLRSAQEDAHRHPVYDLQGRKVKPLAKGIYVVNGKKIVVQPR